MTAHPLTYDLPRGGRHVTPRAVAPTASLRTRVHQLMPVGLLVVATSTAVAVALPHGSPAGASHDAHPSATASPHHAAAGLAAGTTATSGVTGLGPASLAMTGKHRAASAADGGTTSVPTGKHRLDPAPKHARHDNQTDHADHAGPKHQPDPEPAATPSSAAATGSAAAPSAPPAPSASATPSAPAATPTPSDLTPSPTPSLVDDVLGGVLDDVGGLLGGPTG